MTISDCPLDVKTPEFKYLHSDPASTMDIEFGIGEWANKTSCESYISINASEGAYPMHVSVKIRGEWQNVEAEAIQVVIRGSYERDAFKYALQKAGLMTIPFYGTIKDYWEG